MAEFNDMNEEAVLNHIQTMYVEYDSRVRAAELEDKKFLALAKKIDDYFITGNHFFHTL